MTPHELRLAVDAYQDQIAHEREQAVVQAYYTAVWARWVKKPPRLKQILEKIRPKKEQMMKMAPEQWLEVLKKREGVK